MEIPTLTPEMTFADASELWLANHSVYIKPGTLRSYRQYVDSLKRFLGTTPLRSIGIEQVRGYQRSRQERAGGHRINQEVNSALKPILKEADLWDRIARVYRLLPEEKTKVRKSLSAEQEVRLMEEVRKANPKAKVAGHCLLVMANTTMGFGELRHLRREDVFLNDEIPHVTVNGGTKNEYRIRTIPLNTIALDSMRWLLRRWEKLGGTEPDQYILPHHARRSPDQRAGKGHQRRQGNFYEPMGHVYRGARVILKAAGLEGYNPYDMRSHAITKLLSDPRNSGQVCQELAGHVSQAMQRRYSRQLLLTKAAAVATMCAPAIKASRVVMFPVAQNA